MDEKLSFVNSEPEVLDDETKSVRKEERGNYFGLILYPFENESHKRMLDYLLSHPYYEICYMHHKGENVDCEERKDHTHVLVKTRDRMMVSKFVKWFDGWISYAECIHSPKAYLLYMMHDNPESINKGKIPYPASEFRGSERLYKEVLIQNSHFVQLGEVISYHPLGGSFYDTYLAIPDERKADLGSFMWSYPNHVNSALRGENEKYKIFYDLQQKNKKVGE